MRELHGKAVDAQTLLVMLAFQKISNLLESRQIKVDWNADVKTAQASFIGKTGNRCEFRTRVEFVKPPGEAFVFLNYDRGNVRQTDFTGTPAAELTPGKILEYFEAVFGQEI